MNDATHFTNFDYAVIAVMLFSCVFAFFRGLVREVLSLLAWVGAGIITIHYFPSAYAGLQTHFRSQAVAAFIAAVGIYLFALIGFGLINMMIIKSFKSGSESGMLDNMLGLAFGAARGALMVSLGFFLLTVALPEKEYPEWLAQSMTRPYLAKGASLLAKAAPGALNDLASLERKAETETETESKVEDDNSNESLDQRLNGPNANNNNNNPNNPNTAGTTGYTRATTQQLDRLIESTQ